MVFFVRLRCAQAEPLILLPPARSPAEYAFFDGRILDLFHKQLTGLKTDLKSRLINGSDGGGSHGRKINIVKADDRQILGNPDPQFGCGLDHTDGVQVRDGEYGIRSVGLAEDVQCIGDCKAVVHGGDVSNPGWIDSQI